MTTLNRVHLAGNLTRDPELKEIKKDLCCCKMRLAVNDRKKNSDGEWEEKPCYVDVVAWNGQATTSNQFLKKGSPALIEGRLQYEQWKDKEGNNRSKLLVHADRVQFISAGKEGSSS